MSDRRMLNDTQPLEYELKWNDGTAVDLRTSSGVVFIMREDEATIDKANAACVVTDAENGKVVYNFIAADVNAAGMYKYRFKITFTNGKTLSVPSNDVQWLYIVDPDWM